MAKEIERIVKLFQRNWDGPMWYGGQLTEKFKDLSWEKAFQKPAGFSHNIYEYVRHMHCWRVFTLELLKGNHSYSVEINSEKDWEKDYERSEITWLKALADLENSQQQLATALAAFPDEQLDELVPGKKFKWYALLHGVIHHDIYHSAQIAVLRK